MDTRVSLAAAGDEDAFSALMLANYDVLRDQLKREISAQQQSTIDPDDILSETFFGAWQEVQDPRNRFHSDGDFLALLRRIARHRLLDAIKAQETLKRGGNRRRLANELAHSDGSLGNLLDQIESECSSPSAGPKRQERLDKLLSLLDRLTPDHQEVIRLHHLLGYPLAEIAAQLGLSEAQVRGRLDRARQKMRDDLGEFSL